MVYLNKSPLACILNIWFRKNKYNEKNQAMYEMAESDLEAKAKICIETPNDINFSKLNWNVK